MAIEGLGDFNLAGGTALSLQIGHRTSHDLDFLLKRFELRLMLELHKKKYQQDSQFLIMKSLIFFDDANRDAPVVLLEDDITWEEVKETIRHHVNKIGPN